jgi:hypothetical protein
MAPQDPDSNAYAPEDRDSDSSDSGYGSNENATEESRSIDVAPCANPVRSTTATPDDEHRQRTRSRIPLPTRQQIQAHNTTTPSRTRHDEAIGAIRRVLNWPLLSPSPQRVYSSILNSLLVLRDDARSPLPLRQIATRDTRRPVYGPQPRPLSEAAIRQNARARTRRAYIESLGHSGYRFLHAPVYTDQPIRYSHPYDDLLGYRSLDDGTAAAYAERDGDTATYAIRFDKLRHNGYNFRSGHVYITTEDRNLVEARQARALAGLSTKEMDTEITWRVLDDSYSWGTSIYSLKLSHGDIH